MLRATIKGVLAKKFRLLLTALSIVIGVGFVAGTYVLTDTMNAAFDELFDQTAEGTDLIVRSRTRSRASRRGRVEEEATSASRSTRRWCPRSRPSRGSPSPRAT